MQIVRGKELREREQLQSVASSTIDAKRGIIYDCNKKALAISADVDTITVNPKLIIVKQDENVDQEKTNSLKEKMAKEFSDLFQLDYNETLKKLNSDKSIETIAEKVETDKVKELQNWMKENSIYSGINIDEDTKRYYPFNNLASNLIGFCGSDNQGLDGIELEYDDVLKGTNGKLTTAISASQKAIPDSNKEYIAPENGSNLYLTIDSTIQSIAEKYLKQAVEENNCKRGGNVIIENPETGEILAMATYPDYNLNTPYEPNEWIKEGFDKLSGTEKTNKLYSMWRNRAVLDTYEPGSTFKTIIAATALENGITTTDIPGDFYCSGAQKVADATIHCAKESGHGSESLRQALENSCNPALIQLGQRIGKDTLYKYFKLFGLFDKTGIDLPSEGTSTFWDKEDVGPVELATMSFGQRITITPLQLISAISTISNEGEYVKPRIVTKIENPNEKSIENVEVETIRKVISTETSQKIKDMMLSVVTEGTGKLAKVEGYSIGGKSGTSEPTEKNAAEGYVASFVAISPIENTQVVVLVILYDPKGNSHQGGQTAGPVAAQILSEVLPYLGIPSDTTKTKTNEDDLPVVPNLVDKTVAEAKRVLAASGFNVKISITTDENTTLVSDQTPKAGIKLEPGATIYLYTAENEVRVSTTVPNVKGMSSGAATAALRSANLNIKVEGESGIVVSQEPSYETEQEVGTVVNVTIKEQLKEGQ